MNKIWSKLRPLSKLDQLSEVVLRTAFILQNQLHIVNNEYTTKGINFKVVKRVGGTYNKPANIQLEFEVICS